MDSIRGRIIFAFFILTTAASVATAQPQPGASRGFVPRHHRMAASVLRNRPTLPGQAPLQVPPSVANVGLAASEESTSPSDLAPPSPPISWTNDSGKTAPTSVTGSGLDSEMPEQYSITPDAPMESVPDVVFEDPFTPAAGESYGCDSGPSCGGCAGCAGGYFWVDTFSVNLGVAGFKNGINNGLSGSFGFQQGFNWGTPWRPLGLSTQLGVRTIQSEFGGTQFDAGNLNDDYRFQFFVTGGFFKRVDCGWQGGVVFDYLRDEWIGKVDLGQIRGELSWAVPCGSSFGVRFATSVTNKMDRGLSRALATHEFETRDVYTAFYRVQSPKHRLGQWRVFAGFTGNSDGLIGSDFKVPLAGTWSIEPEFTYLIPDETTAEGAPAEEAWNVAFNLVWYPGRGVRGIDYGRLPLFDVAGNGTMISRRLP